MPGSVAVGQWGSAAGAGQRPAGPLGDAGEIVSIDHYGSSAPGTALFEEYGFTGDNVAERARRALARIRG